MIAQFLSKLPDTLSPDTLINNIQVVYIHPDTLINNIQVVTYFQILLVIIYR